METIRYTIVAFTASTVEEYKRIRLEALKNDRGVFGNSYEVEAALAAQQWLERVNNINSACFGLYANDELIGLTGIVIDKEQTESAYMTQSYIRKEYRGKGLSKMLYDARINWAHDHSVKRLKIGHKLSNWVSKAANQRYGFQYIYSESRQWPDGTTEDMVYYELQL